MVILFFWLLVQVLFTKQLEGMVSSSVVMSQTGRGGGITEVLVSVMRGTGTATETDAHLKLYFRENCCYS